MIFDPNQTEFANDCQRTAWQLGIHIVPPEVSLADVKDKETHEGCMQIYNCLMEMLTDMYNHTEGAEEPIGYNTFYLLWLITGIKTAPFKKDIEAYAHFLQKASLYGFTYDVNKNTWENDRYPLLCDYFLRFADLAKKPKRNTGYRERLDFRLFAKRYILTFDDLLRPLPDKEREYFLELRGYVLSKGMKEEMVEAGSFRYVYKNHRSLVLRVYPAQVFVPYGLPDGAGVGAFERFLETAE